MHAYAQTDVGKTRNTNQDYIFSSPTKVGALPNLFIVADGMGGHKAGDYASRYLVENLIAYVENAKENRIVPLIESAVKSVNKQLFWESMKDLHLSGMGTTLVLAAIEDGILYVANVGDSRLYLIRNQMHQVTRDHSYVEELVSLGQLERGSQDYQDNKNIITRALGTKETVEIDFFEVPLKENDSILLCSDGLTNMLTDEEISSVLSASESLKIKVDHLITSANQNGGKDNISVILLEPQIGEVGLC